MHTLNAPRRSRSRRAHSGQVLVIFAMLTSVLIGVVALSIDGGFIMAERRQVQNAADASALAAAKALYDGKVGSMTTSARTYAVQNAGSASSVAMAWPPSTGSYAGNTQFVQVTVHKPVRKFFVGAFYPGDWSATATATAGIDQGKANYALIALDRTQAPGINIRGTAGIAIAGDNGSAMANTTITSNGSGGFTADGTIDAHGAITTGGGTWNTGDDLRAGSPQVADPLAGYPIPSKGTPRIIPSNYCTSNCILYPGYYKDQKFSVFDVATLRPGPYYFENSEVTLKNTNSTLRGDDVLLYFTGSSQIVFDLKNGNLDLSAATTGPWANIALWYTACNALDMQGNGTIEITGVLYAPCAHVTLHGNPSSTTIDGQIFVGTLETVGNSSIKLHYRDLVDTTRPTVFLVE